jgi:hypothetical protein
VRKQIVAAQSERPPPSGESWLDFEPIAQVRLTSEDPLHPVEGALQPGAGTGWRAGEPGEQTIWIDFDAPQSVRRIYLRFEVDEPRTQEFVLRWSNDHGATYRELVRQQFSFAPAGARIEEEEYAVELNGVTGLSLTIVPDIAGGEARASMRGFRLR